MESRTNSGNNVGPQYLLFVVIGNVHLGTKCGTIKIPSCSLHAQFCIPSPAVVSNNISI